ncbi:uncharacterized protein LOC131246849 isoform X2 [Magnolia sinica]|uniref:uncharacterized protein LOC131246849 isoform X2 n=1 Tax=Magnolia sinica TaxID=86752 RepID=UPI00265B5FD6|nr:uncharacterized protein LOC131246849 isoform X2 [Magnolia sinica]
MVRSWGVKRVLRSGGKYICLTLAESHVLGLLFSKFRFGWKINLHAIPHKLSNNPSFQTFMVVVTKESSCILNPIVLSFEQSSLDSNETQARGLLQVLEIENKIRNECSSGVDILYSFEDLQLGIKGDLKELSPGRRIQLTLGEQGDSLFSYKAVLLDSPQQSYPFAYHCGVFLVPKTRAHEWLFSSEEGQWAVVESSKAARLIMVFLDARHTHASMDDIQKDLSPLVKNLAPGKPDSGAQFPFMMANDGVKQRNIIQQITSTMTGPIIVEDVIYENGDSDGSGPIPLKDLVFRRLTFERSLGLVQSEALLVRQECTEKSPGEMAWKKTISSKSRKKGSRRKSDSRTSSIDESRENQKVDHNYLASAYHSGIISGFTLVASKLENLASSGRTVKTVVIGLGAGLLPMFLRRCMPFSYIEVVELDPMILDLAKDHFGFIEDEKLKVHIADGIRFVRNAANDSTASKITANDQNDDYSSCKGNLPFPNGSGANSLTEGEKSTQFDILIIDADSSDVSSGLTCPPADFMEESFLLCVKESLSKEGLFVINLVSRSPAIRETVVSRMQTVFSRLFCLELEGEVNEVLFALPMEVCIGEDGLSEAAVQLEKLLNFAHNERGPNILETAKKINCLK